VPLAHGFLALLRRVGIPTAWRGVRWLLGRPYRSLATYVRAKCNGAIAALGDFEALATAAARKRGADGVVCGHVHVPAMRAVDGTLYLNDGDWVDSCSALVEHEDGRLEILRWTGSVPALERPAREAVPTWRSLAVRARAAGERRRVLPNTPPHNSFEAVEAPRCPEHGIRAPRANSYMLRRYFPPTS